MYFELNYIKTCEGLVRLWRENGVYRTMIFFYKIKPIYKTGRFPKKDFYKTIMSFYSISDSNIRLHLTTLIKIGFIKVFEDYYQLVSYDNIFKYFGYDLSYKKRNGKVLRKGNFAIFKIEIDPEYPNEIEDRIDCGELKLNIRRQEHYLRKVIFNEELMSNVLKEKIIHDGAERIVIAYNGLNIYSSSKNILSKIKDSLTIEKNQKKIYVVSGISCRNIAKILGFKSTKSIFDFKKRCMSSGIFKVISQKVVLKNFTDFCDEVLMKHIIKDFHFKYEFGRELNYQLHDDFLFCL